MKKLQIINGFWIRIIAIISMIIDHIAVLLVSFDLLSIDSNLYYFMRILGRISFPLFAFGIVEGVLHTKNINKYLIRLGLMAIGMDSAIIILTNVIGFHLIFVDNIFLTLFLGALSLAQNTTIHTNRFLTFSIISDKNHMSHDAII